MVKESNMTTVNQQKKGSRRKAVRYVRWGVKLVFLIILVGTIKFFTDAAIDLPVYSMTAGGFSQPLFTVPYGESICSFLLLRWTYVGPGAWIICPVGGSEVLATAAMEPAAGLDITFLLISVVSAMGIFLLTVFLLGAMFCSWICPVGTVVDGFDKAVERLMPKLNKRREERLKQSKIKKELSRQNKVNGGFVCPTCFFAGLFNSKYATVANGILVTAVVGSAIARLPLFCAICPIGAIARGMFHLKAWTNILGARFLNVKNAAGLSIDMPIIVEFAVIIPLVAVLLSLREKRYYCRKICPVGALIKLVSKFNPFLKPVKNPNKCVCPTDYEACKKVCPQGLGPQEKTSSECTKCLECYAQCKNKNVRIKWFETPEAIVSLKNRLKRQSKNKEE
jgi:ferredoxin-type protein NapH